MARWQFFVAKENWLAAWDWVHIHHIHPPPTVKVSAVKVLKQDSVLLEAGCVCLRQDSPGRVMWFCWMASPTSFAHCRIDSGSQSSRLQQSVRHKSYTNSPMATRGFSYSDSSFALRNPHGGSRRAFRRQHSKKHPKAPKASKRHPKGTQAPSPRAPQMHPLGGQAPPRTPPDPQGRPSTPPRI